MGETADDILGEIRAWNEKIMESTESITKKPTYYAGKKLQAISDIASFDNGATFTRNNEYSIMGMNDNYTYKMEGDHGIVIDATPELLDDFFVPVVTVTTMSPAEARAHFKRLVKVTSEERFDDAMSLVER